MRRVSAKGRSLAYGEGKRGCRHPKPRAGGLRVAQSKAGESVLIEHDLVGTFLLSMCPGSPKSLLSMNSRHVNYC